MEPNRIFGWKGRLITRLVVISLIALGVYAALHKLAEYEGKPPDLKLKRTSTWTDQRIFLYSERGGSQQLDAKRADYVAPYQGYFGEVFGPNARIIVFNNPATKKLYIGSESDFYIETSSNIIGAELNGGLALLWHTSYTTGLPPGEKVERALARFEKQVDGPKWWRRRPEGGFVLSDVLGLDFPLDAPMSSFPGEVKIEQLHATNGTLQVDLKNVTRKIAGTIWIDLRTLAPIRGAVNDKQVFPVSVQEPFK